MTTSDCQAVLNIQEGYKIFTKWLDEILEGVLCVLVCVYYVYMYVHPCVCSGVVRKPEIIMIILNFHIDESCATERIQRKFLSWQSKKHYDIVEINIKDIVPRYKGYF